MIKDYTKIIAIFVLYDCILFGCFTTLAIHFDKWWIILFAAIFWRFPKNDIDSKKYVNDDENEE